ncbi:MAG TPA: WYL domain-containing protein [Pseudonocardiaceae bacterium]|nr:WYL domain-containing protein [Pseudonocardiaceae bacterium]
MSTARAERLVNLVLCLLSTRQYLSAEKVRTIVPGYADSPSDEAFFRMFERDKSELRDLGVPLETGRNSAFDTVDGYRIARRDYELPDIDLEPDEAAAVALAARLWDSPDLAGAAHGALVKLRAAGVDVHDEDAAAVQPRVRAAGPAFGPLLSAVQDGRVVRFAYRKHPGERPQLRTLEPWGVVSWRGRWYVVGHDRDRHDTRCFRLSRIVGDVATVGPAGAVRRPEDVDLLSYVYGSSDVPHSATTATLWLAAGQAQGLRRRARVVGQRTIDGVPGDLVEIDLLHLDTAARWITGHGADAVVLAPESLRSAVLARLTSAAGDSVAGDSVAGESVAGESVAGDGAAVAAANAGGAAR